MSRVIAIGDIHGDWNAAVKALELGSLIESRENPTWAGGRTKLVVCGDMLDRGDDEIELMSLFARLRVRRRAK